MIIHYYAGLYSEVIPSQNIGGGGDRNTAVPERARSTMYETCLSEGIYVRSTLYMTTTGAKTAGGQMS